MDPVPEPPLPPVSPALRDAARRAYERGRLRAALRGAWPVPVLAGLSIASSAPPHWVVPVAVLGLAVVVLLHHRGRGLERAVFRGQLAGLLPLVVALASCRVPHACANGSCSEWCMPACLVAAAVGGVGIARYSGRERERAVESLLAAAAVAALIAAMGCAAIGVGSALAVLAGLGMVAAPVAIAAAVDGARR